MEKYSKTHLVIPQGLDCADCTYIEPFEEWRKCYKIDFVHHSFVVNADNETDAIDTVIDWFEDNLPTYLCTDEELRDMSQMEMEEHHCGGNHGRYLTDLFFNIQEIDFPYVYVSILKIEVYEGGDHFEEDIVIKQKVELHNLLDFHEFCLSLKYQGANYYLQSPVSMPTGFLPYEYHTGLFYKPNGEVVEDEYFYDWLTKVVY